MTRENAIESGSSADNVEGDAAFGLVVVASCPPPIAGQSAATAMLLRHLERERFPFRVVDLSREFYDTGSRFVARAKRAARVATLPMHVRRAIRSFGNKPVAVYLQIGQSTSSLIRDIPILASSRRLGARTIVHLHGGGFVKAAAEAPALVRRLLRRNLRHTTRAIVLSASLKAQFEEYIEVDKIEDIANGVDEPLAQFAISNARTPGSHPFTALYLSNLIESKGYVTFLHAAKLSHERGLAHRWILAGRQSDQTPVDPARFIAKHQLQDVAQYVGPAYGQTKFKLLQAADAFVLPTSYPTEGQPISILEAMHFGLPIVTTRAGGIQDIVEHNVNGILIEAGQADKVLHAVDKLSKSSNLTREIARVNIETARSLFREDIHSEATLAAIKTAMSGSRNEP